MNEMKIKDYFAKSITWDATNDAEYPYETVFEGEAISIRLNDFPADELYTLIVDGSEISFDDWPKVWAKASQKAPKKTAKFNGTPRGRLVKAL